MAGCTAPTAVSAVTPNWTGEGRAKRTQRPMTVRGGNYRIRIAASARSSSRTL